VDGADEVFDDVFELALAFDDGAHALQLFGFDHALDHGDGVHWRRDRVQPSGVLALMLTWSVPRFSRSATQERISPETGPILGRVRISVVSMFTMR